MNIRVFLFILFCGSISFSLYGIVDLVFWRENLKKINFAWLDTLRTNYEARLISALLLGESKKIRNKIKNENPQKRYKKRFCVNYEYTLYFYSSFLYGCVRTNVKIKIYARDPYV